MRICRILIAQIQCAAQCRVRMRLGVVDIEPFCAGGLDQRLVGAEQHERPRMAERGCLGGAGKVEDVESARPKALILLREPMRLLSRSVLNFQDVEGGIVATAVCE